MASLLQVADKKEDKNEDSSIIEATSAPEEEKEEKKHVHGRTKFEDEKKQGDEGQWFHDSTKAPDPGHNSPDDEDDKNKTPAPDDESEGNEGKSEDDGKPTWGTTGAQKGSNKTADSPYKPENYAPCDAPMRDITLSHRPDKDEKPFEEQPFSLTCGALREKKERDT